MTDYRVFCREGERPEVIPDHGEDGHFWRDGERWHREAGIEHRTANPRPPLSHEEKLAKAWSQE